LSKYKSDLRVALLAEKASFRLDFLAYLL